MRWMIVLGIVVAVVGCPATAGCRESAPEIVPACFPPASSSTRWGSDAEPDPEVLADGVACLNTYPAVGVVIVNWPVGEVIRLGRESRSEHGRLRAYAWRDGDNRVEAFPRFEWESSDPNVVTVVPGETERETRIIVHRDRFDDPALADPRATVTVCAVNDCERTCRPCIWRICSEPVEVVGLPNLEGRWEVTADTFPFSALVDVQQDGERLITGFADVSGRVEGGSVWFELREVLYTGELEDRFQAEGVIRGGDLGAWSAIRIPPPY